MSDEQRATDRALSDERSSHAHGGVESPYTEQVAESRSQREAISRKTGRLPILAIMATLAVIAAVVFLKDQVNSKFNDAGSKLSSSGS